MKRSRVVAGGLLVVTIAAGLGSRRYPAALPEFVGRFAGDVLWAAAVYALLALTWPRARIPRLALASSSIALVVELSQLHRAPWLDAVRATRAGALALGQGFLWSDLACYAVGVALAAALDALLARRQRPPTAATRGDS